MFVFETSHKNSQFIFFTIHLSARVDKKCWKLLEAYIGNLSLYTWSDPQQDVEHNEIV